MFRNRRLASLILGLWLGAAACVDVVVTQNFSTVDRFLAAPGSIGAPEQINQAGAKTVRFILRRNAGEENAWIFENWEWMQIFIATLFFFLILFGDRPPKLALLLELIMLAIVLTQRIALTPQVIFLGREVAEIPARELVDNPINTRFWFFHGLYSGSEILKLLVGLGLGARLMIRRKDPDRFAKEYDLAMGTKGNSGAEGRGKARHQDG